MDNDTDAGREGGEHPDPPPPRPGWLAEGAPGDQAAPGAGLAAAVAAAAGPDGAGLARLGDGDLLGVIAATHRLMSWLTWVQLTGLATFESRRPGVDGQGFSRDAAEEMSWKTGESWQRSGAQMIRARTCAARLPHSFAALGQGLITGTRST